MPGRSTRACRVGGRLLQLDRLLRRHQRAATAGAPRTGTALQPSASSPTGFMVGGTLGYNYQTGSLVWGLEGDYDWSDVNGTCACAAASTCETANLVRHRPRPRRLRLRPLAAIHHRRRRLRRRQGDSVNAVGLTVERDPDRLDRRRRPRIRLPRQLDRQDRISLRRSRQLRHRRHGADRMTDTSTSRQNIVRAGLNYKFSGPIFTRC